jgi:hypothetical protein
MAFQKRIELDNGIVLENAYIKISSLCFYNKVNDDSYVTVDVNIFKDQQARLDGKPEVTKYTYKCSGTYFTQYFSLSVLNAENVNMISQAYAWMKTMTLYSGATDIQDGKE